MLERFLAELTHLFFFIIPTIIKCNKRFKYRKTHHGTICILANGPSLKDVLKKIDSPEFNGVEFSCMNFFANFEEFEILKPKFYCLVDPMFCQDSIHKEHVSKTFKALNDKVAWNMTLYIPCYYKIKRFLRYSGLTNKNIRIEVLPSIYYKGESSTVIKFLFKNGLTIPRHTVAQTCIYTAINQGFNKILLYGMEHTFINTLAIDEHSRLCWKEEHFYKNETLLKPMLHNVNGKQYKISEYLTEKGCLFRMHDILSEYALSVDCEIINCTPVTMIDSYKRDLK
jgi:hypothetical protein